MQKIASAVIIAIIAFVAVVFGIGALGAISADAVEGTSYEGAFDMAETLSGGAIPILFAAVILMIVGALVLALRGLVKGGNVNRGRGRRGY